MQYGSPPFRLDSSSPVPQSSHPSKLKRTFSEAEESEAERAIPVPLKRRKDPTLRPPTTTTTPPEELLRKFLVIWHPFRHRYTSLPDNHIRILLDELRQSDLGQGERAVTMLRLLVRTYLVERSKKSPFPSRKTLKPKRLVRENLYNALLLFRSKHKDVRIWIDAICINQYNMAEKTKQIKRMAEIYNKARHVRIWLGESGEDTDVAIDFIKKLADFETLASWMALTSLMRSRWFSRRWVLQEQAVARKSTLYCGNAKVDWNDFADAVSIFRTNRDSIFKVLNEPPLQYSTILEVFDGLGATAMVRQTSHLLRRDLKGNILEKRKTLEEVVSEFTSFESWDPRDTIYAVLSIARPQVASSNTAEYIQPNYEKSLLDVYVDFVRYSIECSEGNLDIVCRYWAPVNTVLRASASELNENNRLIKNYVEVECTLPSWIKQLDGSKYGSPDDILRGLKHGNVFATPKPLYNASRSASADDIKHEFGKVEVTADNDSLFDSGISLAQTYNGKLTVRGMILGKIRNASQRISEGTIPREVFEMGGWKHAKQPDDHTVHEMPDQLWRTLVANQGLDGEPCPSYFRRACLYAVQRANTSGDVIIKDIVDHNQTPEVVSVYLRKVQDVIRNRKAFLGGDRRELFGFGSEEVKDNGEDYICIVFGCSVPVILRQVKGDPPVVGQRRVKRTTTSSRSTSVTSSSSSAAGSPHQAVHPQSVPSQSQRSLGPSNVHWRLIGECYVDGRMDGEALDYKKYRETIRDFVLV
ncbi:Heterokaryon incompatibility protein (HET) domain containing protein [Hyaloscypha variabilis]